MSANPPAFPAFITDGMGHVQDEISQPGMTLRDWFAGQALAGFLSDGSQRLINEACKEKPEFLDFGPTRRAGIVNDQLAAGCYILADAMLAERERGQ